MQQERAKNQITNDLLISPLAGYLSNLLPSTSLSAASVLSDFLLPTLVYEYYLQKQRRFSTYITTLDFHKYFNKYPGLSSLLNCAMSTIADDEKELDLSSGAKIIGDLHEGGMTKYLEGIHIKYSKIVHYESYIREILDLFNNSILSNCFPSFHDNVTSISRKYIATQNETDNPEEIQRYYYNLGYTIPVVMLFRAIDLFAQNMTIHLPYPIYFDFECLFSSYTVSNQDYYIQHSGLLRLSEQFDISAITGGTTPLYTYLSPYLSGTEQKPVIKWKVPLSEKFSNIPLLNGVQVKPRRYMQTLIKGYDESAKKIFSIPKDKLINITQNNPPTVRIVLRTTKQYKALLQEYCFPNVYTVNNDAAQFFRDRLSNSKLIYNIQNADKLLDYEAYVLSKGLIPKFYSNITCNKIFGSPGKQVAEFPEPQISIWKKHLLHFHEFLDGQRKILIRSL